MVSNGPRGEHGPGHMTAVLESTRCVSGFADPAAIYRPASARTVRNPFDVKLKPFVFRAAVGRGSRGTKR